MTTADEHGIPVPAQPGGGPFVAGTIGAVLLAAGLWTSLVPAAPRALGALVFVAAGAMAWSGALAMLSPENRRRAVLAAAGVVAGLVVVEVALRAATGSWLVSLHRVNGAWLLEYRPDAQRTNVVLSGKGPEHIAFAVNSQGFRGPELRPPGSAKRIAVYGDSSIAAAATKFEETYCERLRESLRERIGADVEVVNAGVPGTGPDQSCLRMESELATLKPDLVVVAVLAENDYGDIVRNGVFELGSAGELVRRRPETSTVMPRIWGHPDTDVRLEPSSASARCKTALMERVLSRIRDVAIDRSVPLVFLVIPAASDVCANYDGDAADTERHPGYRATNRTRPIETVAAALGVPYVGLYDRFRTTDANHLYFHHGDTHWNSAGQALAAEATAQRITALKLLR